jgi:hypothetical protein
MLIGGIALPQGLFGAERIRDKRPSGTIRAVKYGPVTPIRWGVSAVGKVINRTLLYMEEKRSLKAGCSDSKTKVSLCPVLGGTFGDGAGTAGGMVFHHPNLPVDIESSVRIATGFYQDYSLGLNRKFGAFRTGSEVGYRHMPQEDFFGQGSETLDDHRSTFALSEKRIGWVTRADFGKLNLQHGIWGMHAEVGPGTDSRFPTAQKRFSSNQVDGGFSNDHWLTNQVDALLDFRDDSINPRSGTAVDGSLTFHNGIRETEADFTTARLTGFYYLPLSERKNNVIAIRAEAISTLGDEAPFYVAPTLGGSGTLRGFREYRFRDRDAVAITTEYRYRVWRWMDSVFFADLGHVYGDLASETGDKPLRSSLGVGVKLSVPEGINLRLSVGHSCEGTRLFLKFGPTW